MTVAVKRVFCDFTIKSAQASLTFTATDWDVAQMVTVSVGQDGGGRDEGCRLNLTSPGVASTSVWVNSVDDDRQAGGPRAIISRPLPGETVSGATAEFFGDGRDDVGAVRAEFYVNDVLRFTDYEESGHFHIGGDHNMWNSTLLPNGNHAIRLRVFDQEGQAASHEIKIKVAN